MRGPLIRLTQAWSQQGEITVSRKLRVAPSRAAKAPLTSSYMSRHDDADGEPPRV